MRPNTKPILVINRGSSSLKFALYERERDLPRIFHGTVERIGLSGTNLSFTDQSGRKTDHLPFQAADHASISTLFLNWLGDQVEMSSLQAVGHRVVHGMKHPQPEIVTPDLLDELHRISSYDPDHLPGEIDLIEEIGKRYPSVPQLLCFDTTFHRTMPRVARLLPLPRRFEAMGVERYGFHGLSYEFLMEELRRVDPTAAAGRVILAHLGNGASLAAVLRGQSIDTSMGFTPASGLVMSTRSGDLDPGLVNTLAKIERMSPAQFDHMINHEAGLLGVSGTSSDMRDLLDLEEEDVRAAEAVQLFCYQAKKWIGSFAAVLGGLDALVFSGGIGENAPLVRERICEGLAFLGVEVDSSRNSTSPAGLISPETGRVVVRVIRTDEELIIARSVERLLS